MATLVLRTETEGEPELDSMKWLPAPMLVMEPEKPSRARVPPVRPMMPMTVPLLVQHMLSP